jgi:gephyrin
VVVRAAVLTVSDTVSAGAGTDRGGPAVVEALAAVGDALGGLVVVETAVVPDEVPAIAAILAKWCDGGKVDLVLTTGGTGFRRSVPIPLLPDDTSVVKYFVH